MRHTPHETHRAKILGEVKAYGDTKYAEGDFVPGNTVVPVSGKVLRAEDLVAMVDASLDGWLTAGRFTEKFERSLARYVGVRGAVFVNSGSSANLVALSALTSPKLGKRRLVEGDEVLTVAMGFPTTVNPIIQNRLTPDLVDVELLHKRIDLITNHHIYSFIIIADRHKSCVEKHGFDKELAG